MWTNMQEWSGYYMAPNIKCVIMCKSCNSPVKSRNWEYKFDMKVSNSNMFNPIFEKKVQEQAHPMDEPLQNQEYLASKSMLWFKMNGHWHKLPNRHIN